MNKLHPKIWELIIKSYKHAYRTYKRPTNNGNEYLLDLLKHLPLSTKFKKNVEEYRRQSFIYDETKVSHLEYDLHERNLINENDLIKLLSSLSLNDSFSIILKIGGKKY